MGVIAICIITFDSGIGLEIKTLKKTFLKSFILTIITFFSVVIAVGLTVTFLMPENFNILEGLLLGTMVGGISTVAVKSLLDGIGQIIPDLEQPRTLLILESTLGDPIRVVAAITLIRMIMLPGVVLIDSAKDIVYTFVMGSLVGLVTGLIWSEILAKLRGQPFNYIMTLAALFPTYIFGETIGNGGGTMAAFTFGLVLANHRQVARSLSIERRLRTDTKRLIDFNDEIIFLLKSYYFVYIGLIVNISREFLLYGVIVMFLLLVVRYIVATGIGGMLGFSEVEKVVSRVVYALGTSTIVMSQLPLILDPEMIYITNPGIYADLCFPVVLGTVIFVAIISPVIARRQLR
jgi:cell volume regulation protein A